ncbi:nuclear receptor subfamily 0, group B, member 2b [Puntigrus tetrazona]|uniref:nuclear receptor subfamily 0, group B, member 2b n=1 Tax=Puntigrus tetrazona TaxID=1606681 RepID=UPI001C8AA605|nr:nuclear receptor subfamily 0, group B, member 2b [Puntigrus tetrazona]
MKEFFSDRHPRGILFSILSREGPDARSCHCKRSVRLRSPETTCRAAFGVLIKTIDFMKSLPSFQSLALRERLVLAEERWEPLFLLGLAQDHVTFEVKVVPEASILRNILMYGRQKADDRLPSLEQVHRLRAFLNKVWSLDLSLQEYSCLKGAMLFSHGAPGLKDEARTAPHRTLTDMLFMARALQMEARSLATELFLDPSPATWISTNSSTT